MRELFLSSESSYLAVYLAPSAWNFIVSSNEVMKIECWLIPVDFSVGLLHDCFVGGKVVVLFDGRSFTFSNQFYSFGLYKNWENKSNQQNNKRIYVKKRALLEELLPKQKRPSNKEIPSFLEMIINFQ